MSKGYRTLRQRLRKRKGLIRGLFWDYIQRPFHIFFWKVQSFFESVRAVCSYSKFLWRNHHDFDWAYLLRLLEYKLKRMEKFFKSDECMSDTGLHDSEQLTAVLNLIKEYQDEPWYKEEHDALNEKWGDYIVDEDGWFHPSKATTPELDEQASQDWNAYYEMQDKKKEEVWNTIWNTLRDSLHCWWD